MREYLNEQGLKTQRLTNANNFLPMTSTIFYREGWEQEAAALARLLPIEVALTPATDQRANVRLELGGDLLDFDH